ncbi:hypothetical protein AB1N83_010155 [Pleurotus pulmonarius]
MGLQRHDRDNQIWRAARTMIQPTSYYVCNKGRSAKKNGRQSGPRRGEFTKNNGGHSVTNRLATASWLMRIASTQPASEQRQEHTDLRECKTHDLTRANTPRLHKLH